VARKLVVEIIGDTRPLERSFKKLGGQIAAGYVGFNTLTDAVRASFNEMANHAQVSAQTTAALRSTGRQANVTAKQIEELANTMLRKTGIDDEATQSAENQLLAFRNIRNEVGAGNDIFNRATQAVADLATRMNRGAVPSAEQMQAASIKLGKALNDPVKGLTALRRVGIQFSDAQTQQIKSLVDAGRTMDAQKLILDELTRKYGGAAQAAGKTLPGQIAILQESLRNLGGDMANKFAPDVIVAVNALEKMVGALKDVNTWSHKAGGSLGSRFGKTLTRVLGSGLPKQIGYFKKQIRVALSGPTGPGPDTKGSPLGAGTPADMRSTLAPLVPAGLWLPEPPPRVLATVEQNARSQGAAIRRAWAKGAASKQAKAQAAAGARYTELRNTWFDQMIGRQLGRVGDVGLPAQLKRLREIAGEIQKKLADTHDPTRRLNLQDRLLDIARQERDVHQQITDNIKQGNQALRDRADAIKSAVLGQLQRGQQQLENRQQLQDAMRQLALARRIGGPMGIQAAARDVQKARFAITYANLEAAPAKLRGGQFAYGGVTINVHGVTDPEKVARAVVTVLERRKRHTSTQSRGATVDAGASTAPR
jgi:hypothetical protein